MHELSLCRAIADIAAEHAGGRGVARVRLDIGQLRQVVPDTMRYSWRLVVADSPLADAELDINHVPAVIRCRECSRSTTLVAPVFRCGCGSTGVDVVSGEEFHVTALDLVEG